MQLNPNVAIGLNIAYVVVTGLSIPVLNTLGFTANAPVILAWAGMGGVVINAILHAYSSSQPGPLAPPDPPAVVAATVAAAPPKAAP